MRRIQVLAAQVTAAASATRAEELMAPAEQPLRQMTPDELATLMRDGVVCLKNVLPQLWIDRLRAAVDEQASGRGPPNMTMNSDKFAVQSSLTWYVNDKFHDIIMGCPTAHLAQQALNALAPSEAGGTEKEVRFFYDQMFVKHAAADEGIAGNTPWHHDITFWPVRGEQIISIWCPLDPVNLENGGLEFVPGSHTWKNRYKSYGVGIDFPSDVLEDLPKLRSATNGDYDAASVPPADQRDVVYFETDPGDVIVFSTLVMHGAPPNRAVTRQRRALSLRYMGTDVVIDDAKYGPGTLLSPFTVFDESRGNGDAAAGFTFPKLLPSKDRAEVERRLHKPILPAPKLMKAWLKRKRELDAAQKKRDAAASVSA